MMRVPFLYLCLLLGLLGLVTPVQADNGDVARRQADMQVQINSLDTRIGRIEDMLQNGAMLNLLSEVEALKAQVKKLRGDVDVQSNDISVTQKRQNDLYMDLDTRLRNLVKAETPPVAAVPDAEASTASTPSAAEAGAYEAALGLFKAAKYPAAISAFNGFIKTYPTSTLAPSAQYWIGNAQFAHKDYKAALASQQKLVATYPSSPKVADAMLNISSAQFELGDTKAARKTLEELVRKYPGSSAAELAKKRLTVLK
jgi:tol-pal system protein YbgF